MPASSTVVQFPLSAKAPLGRILSECQEHGKPNWIVAMTVLRDHRGNKRANIVLEATGSRKIWIAEMPEMTAFIAKVIAANSSPANSKRR